MIDHNNISQHSPQLIIVMGVSGSGKSTVAKSIAQHCHFVYLDADDFHSDEAKQMMANNQPLSDEQRLPWIARICQQLSQYHQKDNSVVLAYSGLKRAHRDIFRQLAFTLHFVLLRGSEALIAKRLSSRRDHFMSAQLLKSQFEALESPAPAETDVICINIDAKPQQILAEIFRKLTTSIKELNQ